MKGKKTLTLSMLVSLPSHRLFEIEGPGDPHVYECNYT